MPEMALMRKNSQKRMGYLWPNENLGFLCEISDNEPFTSTSKTSVASNKPIKINSFSEFMTRLAYLSQNNPSLKILYRGQKDDYQCIDSKPRSFKRNNPEKTKSSLFPTLAREIFDMYSGELKKPLEISIDGAGCISVDRFINEIQKKACDELFFDTSLKSNIGHWNNQDELQQLAVLQHYEVIPTLMFDLSSDINTALFFGFNEKKKSNYFYVFGVPYRGEAISVFPDEELLVVDLSRLLPPEALRPHFQCGFTITSHPAVYKKVDGVIHSFEEEHRFPLIKEWDYSRLLLAKFELTSAFWSSEFAPSLLPKCYYYPDNKDLMYELTKKIRESIGMHQ